MAGLGLGQAEITREERDKAHRRELCRADGEGAHGERKDDERGMHRAGGGGLIHVAVQNRNVS